MARKVITKIVTRGELHAVLQEWHSHRIKAEHETTEAATAAGLVIEYVQRTGDKNLKFGDVHGTYVSSSAPKAVIKWQKVGPEVLKYAEQHDGIDLQTLRDIIAQYTALDNGKSAYIRL